MSETNAGILYIVATPIGNLEDMTERARTVLEAVDLIAAEDTRHSKHMLSNYGITTRLQAYHDHNEESQSPKLLAKLQAGESIALISDAGTPLINDPGFRLVALAHENNVQVVPVPGSCAAIAALSASGLTVNRFTFEGFPSAKQGSRIKQFEALSSEQRTIVFYVSSHKVIDTLKDMATVFGEDREITFAREITKTFETIRKSTLGEMCEWVEADLNQRKGEIVVVIEGSDKEESDDPMRDAVLLALIDELPIKQAAKIAAKITGASKNDLYKQALKMKEGE